MTTSVQIDEHITLRPPDPAYAEALQQIIEEQYDHLHPWLPWVKKNDTPDKLRRFLRVLAAFNQGGQRFTAFIFFDYQLAGSVGLMRINTAHRRGEMGYWLRRELQGQGIITRCCQWLIDYAFQERQLRRLEIHIPHHNKRSLAVARRLGFRHEGTLRRHLQLDGRFWDTEVFGLLEEERGTEGTDELMN